MFDIKLPDQNQLSVTGEMGGEQLEALNKALTAGYGSDTSQFTGGSALRIQSLDRTMKATIQENEHFRLFNALAKSGAGATVDEWTERSGVGGFLGGSTNTETGVIAQSQGEYKRRVAQVKYLMTRAEVSVVVTLGNNLAPAKAVEAQNAALRLLTDAEYLSFEGDAAVVPTEFSGIWAQMQEGVDDGSIDGDNIIDCNGQALASVDYLNRAARVVAGRGNYGRPTHLFTSLDVQADFDTGLDPAFRVPLPDVADGGLKLGAPVVGIRTSHGNIRSMPDVFVRDGKDLMPFQVEYAAIAAANAGLAPAGVAIASANDAASKFAAGHAGNYYYLVTGLNAGGQSTGVITTQEAVVAGEKVTLTITKSAAGAETGYAIYRSRKNGSNAVNDFRLVKRIPRTGASTVFVDLNRDIPGTSKAALLNMSPGADAISWRQLLPMMEFQLYPTNSPVLPWAQLLFGYLRLAKRRQHVVLKNILSDGATWKPFE
jgi:hypothetical protein